MSVRQVIVNYFKIPEQAEEIEVRGNITYLLHGAESFLRSELVCS